MIICIRGSSEIQFSSVCAEKVETTIEEAEKVSDVIEEVAETVKKVAEEAVNHLPHGKLRDAVEVVEDVAEEIDKDAHIAGDALEKVSHFSLCFLYRD